MVLPRLGILETDIHYDRYRLINRRNGSSLPLRRMRGKWFQIGQLLYHIDAPNIDLGMLARQPKIWTGNPAMIAFCPVKEDGTCL